MPEKLHKRSRSHWGLALIGIIMLLSAAKAGAQLPSAQLPNAQPLEVQLPDAPSAIAPLKRFALNVGLDNKYSLTTSLYDFTPRMGVSVRLGERETMGLSFSHATVMNDRHQQSNSVVVWTNFRVLSWGKIPR